MPKRIEWLHQPAADWNTETSYHGFARVEAHQLYSVRLSVNGRQVEISKHKSQHEAAEAYDAALWKLLPFTPLRAKPNFPLRFDSWRQSDVDSLCPYANTLFAELESSSKVSVEELRRRRSENVSPERTNEGPKRNPYSVLESRAERLCIDLHRESIKFSNAIQRVDLRKFSQLAKELIEVDEDLRKLSVRLMTLRATLEGNRAVHLKLTTGNLE